MNRPNFIGVGEQKCGTTWVSECLRYHPEVFMSSPKELFFFGQRYHELGMEWYLSFFEGAQGYKAAGEFSTNYLRRKTAIDQILRSLGEIRIIVCIRNPTKRFISECKHRIRLGSLPRSEFLTLDIESYERLVDLHSDILHKGYYSKNIERYMDAFGADRVHVVDNKAMSHNPVQTVSEMYRFLQVDPGYRPPIIDKRLSRGIVPRSQGLEHIRRTVWGWLRRIEPRTIDFLKRTGIGEWYRRINAAPGLTVPNDVIVELNAHYSDEVSDLEGLLGRDLDWEGF